MNILANSGGIGAQVLNFDLSKPLGDEEFCNLELALGTHSVLCFPSQQLSSTQLKEFAERFGTLEINVANTFQDPVHPEVMILSNKVDATGQPICFKDAGQDWHTDMSYSKMIAFANILYGIKIPYRNGKSLGNTEFSNMQAAYEGLPKDIQKLLENKTITHDFNKFWEKMRQEKGSSRPPLTPEQLRAKPPVTHPAILIHPISKKKVLYANPGYSIRINELPEDESILLLDLLFEHQLQEKYRYAFEWEEKTVLMWDNMGTIHNAVADYLPHEHRYIKRCQVAANLFF